MHLGRLLLLSLLACVHSSILSENYYERLEVSQDAEERLIRSSFKKLALQFHPDKNPNDDEAHAKMVELNEALAVLTDPNQRAAYDKGGKSALKAAGKSKTSEQEMPKNMQGLQFYESFGMYDDDLQIEILDYHQWEASHYSTDAWLITFFSPRCSQCHDMSDDWRRVGGTLRGAFHVAAVNCDDNWPVCEAIGVENLPTVVLYKKGEPRNTKDPLFMDGEGAKSYDEIMTFAYDNLPNVVHALLPEHYQAGGTVPFGGSKGTTWVVGYCSDHDACDELATKQKLVSMILNDLVQAGSVNCEAFQDVCRALSVDPWGNDGAYIVTHHAGGNLVSSIDRDVRDIAHEALRLLPPLAELSIDVLLDAASNVMQNGVRNHAQMANPTEYLILFINQADCQSDTPELGEGSSKCYQTLLNFRMVMKQLSVDWEYNDLRVGTFNCDANAQAGDRRRSELCGALSADINEPTLILLKEGAMNPYVYHDRIDRDEQVLSFVQEAYRSTVHELDHDDFEAHIVQEKQTWFVDFFAPWCHHCRDVWPEYNQASKHYDLPKDVVVHFAKVNCETHHEMCMEHHVQGYPTFLLYHEGVRHQYDFDHRTAEEFVRFIKETLEPVEFELTTESYSKMLSDPYNPESAQEILEERWVVDFFAPWCSHCHVMSPKFREAAKALRGVVKFGKFNCELDSEFCMVLGIRAYPTIWRFEIGQPRGRPTAQYPGQPDPKLILDFAMAEVADFVREIKSTEFDSMVKNGEDSGSHFVLFWSSKESDCVDCEQMRMKIKALASRYEAKFERTMEKMGDRDPVAASRVVRLQFASFNCRASGADYTFCLKERIKKFPTLVYYSGANNEQKVIKNGDDMLKVISDIDKFMAEDRRAIQHPFRERHDFVMHDEL